MSGAARDLIAEDLTELRAGLRVPVAEAEFILAEAEDQLCETAAAGAAVQAGQRGFRSAATAWNGQASGSQTNGASGVGFSHLYARSAYQDGVPNPRASSPNWTIWT